jgi:hypothetical protein
LIFAYASLIDQSVTPRRPFLGKKKRVLPSAFALSAENKPTSLCSSVGQSEGLLILRSSKEKRVVLKVWFVCIVLALVFLGFA